MPPTQQLSPAAMAAARRMDEASEWITQLVRRLDAVFMGREVRGDAEIGGLIDKARQIYLHARIEGMSDPEARSFVDFVMTAGMAMADGNLEQKASGPSNGQA